MVFVVLILFLQLVVIGLLIDLRRDVRNHRH